MEEKPKWRYYVNNEGDGKYHWFKSRKVWYAYKWWVAEQIDAYTAITPIKTQFGNKLDPTNYRKQYE